MLSLSWHVTCSPSLGMPPSPLSSASWPSLFSPFPGWHLRIFKCFPLRFLPTLSQDWLPNHCYHPMHCCCVEKSLLSPVLDHRIWKSTSCPQFIDQKGNWFTKENHESKIKSEAFQNAISHPDTPTLPLLSPAQEGIFLSPPHGSSFVHEPSLSPIAPRIHPRILMSMTPHLSRTLHICRGQALGLFLCSLACPPAHSCCPQLWLPEICIHLHMEDLWMGLCLTISGWYFRIRLLIFPFPFPFRFWHSKNKSRNCNQ